MMFNVPEMYGTVDYLLPVDDDKMSICEDRCRFKSQFPCDEDVFQLCCILMEENGLRFPSNPDEAIHVYKTLRQALSQALS